MKKFILMSLIATFVSVFSANAQENTYSVIIKMTDGTTFTIGPNDVENIMFNDGQVTVSGTNIQDLVNRIKASEEQIKTFGDQLSRTAAWRISAITMNWEYSTDGGNTWTDTGVCAQGKNGADGMGFNTSYSLVTFNSEDGKWYVVTYDRDGCIISYNALDFTSYCGYDPSRFERLEDMVNSFYAHYIYNSVLQNAIDKITNNNYTTQTELQNLLTDYYTKAEVYNKYEVDNLISTLQAEIEELKKKVE